MSQAENPHFELGPFCGSCPWSAKLHIGCVVENSARKVAIPKNSVLTTSESPSNLDSGLVSGPFLLANITTLGLERDV